MYGLKLLTISTGAMSLIRKALAGIQGGGGWGDNVKKFISLYYIELGLFCALKVKSESQCDNMFKLYQVCVYKDSSDCIVYI